MSLSPFFTRGLAITCVCLGSVLLGACSWVKPTTNSHKVLLVDAQTASSCKKLGSTSAKTLGKVIVVSRKSDKMYNELVTLAKNEAAIMNGDSIVPETEIKDGRMTFGVYRCR